LLFVIGCFAFSGGAPLGFLKLAHGPSSKTQYTADQVDFFTC
jgi:hypothetical protein